MSNASSKPVVPALTPPEVKVETVPWNSAWGVGFTVLVFFGSQILTGILLSVYPLLRHWTAQEATDWLTTSTNAQFVYILLTEAVSIGAIYLFLRNYKLTFAAIGLRRPRWTDVGLGIAAVVPYYVLYALTVGIVSNLVSSLDVNQQQQLGFDHVQGGLQLFLTFICLVVLPPIAEEIMVRGFLYSSLRKAVPVVYAVILTSLIFAAAHLPEGGAAGPLYIAALDTFVLSLVLIFLRELTGGLWASMTLHAIKNGIAFTALFALHLR